MSVSIIYPSWICTFNRKDDPLIFLKPVNYRLCRNIPQPRAIEMETVEAIPMAGDTSSREEDTGRHSPLNL